MIDVIIRQFEEFYLQIGKLNQEAINLWVNHIVFTWRWWFALGLLVVPWIIWFRLRPKQGWGPILLAGLVSYIFASILDAVGVAFGMWSYPIIILPYLHSFYVPWDLTCVPVTIMFFLQYKPKVSAYLKAFVFFGKRVYCGALTCMDEDL